MELTETIIIEEILKGDKEKYALLMRKYNQRLYRICKGYLTDESEIEDVMQEAYIKAFQNLTKFKQQSSFGTWLTRILINQCLQILKKSNRFMHLEDYEDDSKEMKITNNENPEMNSINLELKQLLERNIEQLPEKYRMVFIMREVEKISTEETSELLNITPVNVKVRLNRAKEMLRDLLLKNYTMQEVFDFNLVRCSRIASQVMARI